MVNDTNTNINLDKDKGHKTSIKSILEARRSILANVESYGRIHRHIPRYGWIPDIPDHRDYLYSDHIKKMEEDKEIVKEKEKEVFSDPTPISTSKIIIPVPPVDIHVPTPVSNIVYTSTEIQTTELQTTEIQTTEVQKPTQTTSKTKSSIPINILPIVDLRPMDSPIFDQGDLGCHDSETEVLTSKGWKLFSDLSQEDELATVNPETSELIYEKPTKIFRYHHKGTMICGKSRDLDFKVTVNHKMLVRKWNEKERKLDSKYNLIEAKNLGWYIGLLNRVLWKGISDLEYFTCDGVDHQQIPQREDVNIEMKSWLRFLGIYLADGTIIKEDQNKDEVSYKIQIAGEKERKKDFYRETLKNIGVNALELEDRFTFNNKRIYKTMESLGLKGVKAPQKFVPEFIFDQSSDNIKEFLLGFFTGDGCDDDGVKSLYTSSQQLSEDLQRLIFLSGNESRIYVREPRSSILEDGRIIKGNYPEHRISLCERKNACIERKKNLSIGYYDGEVFCAEVSSYHTLVTRRNKKILISGNSCTGNALAGMLQFLEKKDNVPYIGLSRLFIYYDERVVENTVGSDSGAQIRDGIKTLENLGVCSESCWPYDISKFTIQPGHTCYIEAANHKILSYYRLNTLDDMVNCLDNGYPFVFGFSVYDSFESQEVSNTGIVNMPGPDENQIGGHAVCCVGYDNNQRRFIVRNSWGNTWGQRGYFTIPFDYLADRNLSDDFWTIRRGMNL